MIQRDEAVKVTIDGDDYQHISGALDLARVYIDNERRKQGNRSGHGPVGAYSAKEMQLMESAMYRYWGQ